MGNKVVDKKVIKEFEEKGLGPLYTELENGDITSQEFVDRLEHFENRPILRLGRFIERLWENIFS
jgi:hypothetical protein